MRVDCQVHVVSPDRERYPLDPPVPDIEPWFDRTARSAEELVAEMRGVGIDRAVLVQPYSAYRFDNRYTADAASAYPDSFASVCTVDLDADPVADAGYWVSERGARGIRLFLQRRADRWLGDPASDGLFDVLARLGVVAQAAVAPHQLPDLLAAARRHPDVPVLVDHCGNVDLGGPGLAGAGALFEMAGAPNAHVKVSTQVFERARGANVAPAELVGRLVAAFGAERVVWASDLTVHPYPYGALVAEAQEACAGLDAPGRQQVLGAAATRLFWPTA